MSQDLGEQNEQYIQEKKNRRNRLLSRIGLFLLLLSLCSGSISTFIEVKDIYPTPKPTPFPIIKPVPSLSATAVPTTTLTTLPTATATNIPITTATNIPTATATNIPTTTPTDTPTPIATPTFPPILTVNPQSLDTNICTGSLNSWTCVVSLAETANSQGNANWTVSSTLSNVEYFPGNSGTLMPGQSIMITIDFIPCQNGSFTFSGMEGETPVVVPWSCTTISTSRLISIKKHIPTPTPVLKENQVISNTTMSNIKIVSSWPHMALGQSVEIIVSLVTTPYIHLQLTATSAEEKSSNGTISNLIPVGTPNVAISNVFGIGYQTSAVAQLYGTAFEIQPNVEQIQTLDQPIVSFKWNVLPKIVGQQNINVSIMGQWTSRDGKSKERLIGQPYLSIEVDEGKLPDNVPFIAFGQITFSEVLVGLLGSILNVPWILDYSQKRKKEKMGKQKLPPHRSNTPLKSQRKKRRRN